MSAEEGRYDTLHRGERFTRGQGPRTSLSSQSLRREAKMRRKITSVAIIATMVLMGFLVIFGGQSTAATTYVLEEVPYEWDTDYGSALSTYDDQCHYMSMGHAFTLYDMTTTVMTISENGAVKMGTYDSYISWSNTMIGIYNYDMDYALMPFWDDLYSPAHGTLYYYTSAQKTVVTWYDMAHYYGSYASHTFQLVLKADNTFQFNYMNVYPSVPNFVASPSVGCAKQDNSVDAFSFYYSDGYGQSGTPVVSGMSVGIGEAAPRVKIWEEDFESGMGDWTLGWAQYPYNLWHITQHRYTSPTHSLYYGRENYWDYNIGMNYGMIRSPWITIDGAKPELGFQTFYRGEMMYGNYYDRCLVYMSRNYSPTYWFQGQVYGQFYAPWHEITMPLSAYEGDDVQFLFYFHTIDSIANNYEGWYIDDMYVSVEGEAKPAELVVTDQGWMREDVQPGGGGLGWVTVEEIAGVKAKVKAVEWSGTDIMPDHIYVLGDQPKSIEAYGTATFYCAAYVEPDCDAGVTGLDFFCEYNNPDPCETTVDIGVVMKETGNDRAEDRHAADALRHMLALSMSIEDGVVSDDGHLMSAVGYFQGGMYKPAKNQAVKPPGVYGLGKCGLAPGQVGGNEGNGNH
jgi:hypothetical protein